MCSTICELNMFQYNKETLLLTFLCNTCALNRTRFLCLFLPWCYNLSYIGVYAHIGSYRHTWWHTYVRKYSRTHTCMYAHKHTQLNKRGFELKCNSEFLNIWTELLKNISILAMNFTKSYSTVLFCNPSVFLLTQRAWLEYIVMCYGKNVFINVSPLTSNTCIAVDSINHFICYYLLFLLKLVVYL